MKIVIIILLIIGAIALFYVGILLLLKYVFYNSYINEKRSKKKLKIKTQNSENENNN